ncbi:MAG: hypothetical protein Rhob2KO_23120 [Rhodopirellula baltica]
MTPNTAMYRLAAGTPLCSGPAYVGPHGFANKVGRTKDQRDADTAGGKNPSAAMYRIAAGTPLRFGPAYLGASGFANKVGRTKDQRDAVTAVA